MRKAKVLMTVLTNLSFLSAVTILTGSWYKDPISVTVVVLGCLAATLGSWEVVK